MRLSIKWQLAAVSVALSLLPLAVTGLVAYRIARGALEQSIRFNLDTPASQSDEKPRAPAAGPAAETCGAGRSSA